MQLTDLSKIEVWFRSDFGLFLSSKNELPNPLSKKLLKALKNKLNDVLEGGVGRDKTIKISKTSFWGGKYWGGVAQSISLNLGFSGIYTHPSPKVACTRKNKF